MKAEDDMYRDYVLDYYRNPRNYGKLERPDITARDVNVMCGDEVELGLKLSSDKCTVEDVRFSGRGCVISQVSASMLTERIKGKSVEEVSKLSKEDVLKLLGIEISAMRLKCALLGLKVLKIGVYDHLGKQAERNGLDEGIF